MNGANVQDHTIRRALKIYIGTLNNRKIILFLDMYNTSKKWWIKKGQHNTCDLCGSDVGGSPIQTNCENIFGIPVRQYVHAYE